MSIDLLAPPDDRAVGAALDAFSEAIRKRYGPRLEGIHLFGSRARGDFRPLSDVDIAVVVAGAASETLDERVALYDLAYDLLLETGAEIQPWLFDAREWVDPSRSVTGNLIRSAQRDSRPIWVPS